MKRLILLLFIVCVGISFVFISRNPKKEPRVPISPTPTPAKQIKTVTIGNNKYAYAYFSVSDYSRLRLIANFDKKLTSQSVISDSTCSSAINAGFYSTTNKPIGLWKNEEETLGEPTNSTLLNGFYWINNRAAYITYTAPQSSQIAFQTGPILINGSETVALSIKNDAPARRMVAAITQSGDSLFMTIYDPQSILRGPYLNDLPKIVEQINKQLPATITSAINLDGGGASVFISGDDKVSEIEPVGSILCLH